VKPSVELRNNILSKKLSVFRFVVTGGALWSTENKRHLVFECDVTA